MKTTSCDTRTAIVKKAAAIALIGNLILALAKILVGISSKSLSILGDGIDSSTDVLIAIMSLAISFYMIQPSDKKHPWGHTRAETLGTMILSFVIFFAGAQLFTSSISRLKNGTQALTPNFLSLATIGFSILGKLFLAYNQYVLGKKAGSSMILANAKNMLTDIFISLSVGIGLITSLLFKISFIDAGIALIVSFFVMKSGFTLFKEQNLELMDGNADEQLYQKLFDAVLAVPGAKNPHKARIRKMATCWDIDLDIEVSGSLTVTKAHEIAQNVEKSIREAIPDVYDIMVHIEPNGLGEHDEEQFGLKRDDF